MNYLYFVLFLFSIGLSMLTFKLGYDYYGLLGGGMFSSIFLGCAIVMFFNIFQSIKQKIDFILSIELKNPFVKIPIKTLKKNN